MDSSQKVLIIELNTKQEYQKLLAGEPQTSGMRSGRVYLAPGEECGLHSTKANEEVLVFLSGTGEAIISQKDHYKIGSGKVSYIPPHTDHNIKNTGSEPLVYIYCVAPVNKNGK